MPRKWSDQIGLRLTLNRLAKIDDLLVEIGGMWGDIDQYIVDLVDEYRADLEELKADITASVQERIDRERDAA